MTTTNSENEPRRMADALPVLISYLDAERRFRFNNAAFASWFDLDPVSLNGRHLADLLGPEKSAELKPYVDAALAGRQVTFQTTLTRSDGKSIYAQIIHVPQVGADGRAVGFYSLVTDISQIRHSQKALSASEALYHSLVDQLPMCLIQKDLDSRFTFVNRQFCEFTGLESADVIGKLDADLFPGELASKYREDDLKVQRTGDVFETVERNVVDVDGESVVRWVQILKSPVRDADKQIIGTQVLFWDVTAKHAAEEALKEGTALKRAIFDSALDCIAIVDQDGIIIDLNRSAERVFGYSRRELVGANIDDTLFPPILKERQRSNREKAGDESEEGSLLGKRVEIPAMKKDGRAFQVEMAMQPVPYQGKTVFAMFLHDITERKKAEEEIAQMNSDLQTLLYVTSHDLREPLRAIRSFSQLLTDRISDKIGESEQGFLQRVIDGADRLDRLLEDVLMLSRAQRAAEALDEVNAKVVIEDVVRQLDVRIADTNATITVADELPDIRADARWLRQSFFNLIANALKFTNEGETPNIEISAYEPRPDDEEPVNGLVISDRGPGVAPEHADRIFQLFQRAVGRKVEGTGAGLAIVKQVANRYGGNAWVEPRDGGGANFFITFAR